jgi:hypothetical protein
MLQTVNGSQTRSAKSKPLKHLTVAIAKLLISSAFATIGLFSAATLPAYALSAACTALNSQTGTTSYNASYSAASFSIGESLTFSYTDDGGDTAPNAAFATDYIRIQDTNFTDAYGYNYSSSSRISGLHFATVTSSQLTSNGLSIYILTGTHIGPVSIACTGPAIAPTVADTTATVAANSSANPVTLPITGTATAVAVVSDPSHGTTSVSGTSITYTPTTGYAGADSFTYTASNSGSISTSATVDITVTTPSFTFSPVAGALAGGTVGTAYANQTIFAAGGTASYGYTVTGGVLPAGLSLAPSGVISGTPTAAGSFGFSVKATDSTGFTGTTNYTITVAATVPGAPTIGLATAGDGRVSVAFTAPPSNGGASITSYTVSSNSGAVTATGSSSPITITGLTNGSAYSFTVRAMNSAGTSAASAASNSVTPVAALLAPIAKTVTASVAANSSANVITPNLTGGAAISVAISANPAHGTAATTGASITYTPTAGYSGTDSFSYTATNTVGTSTAATVSVTVSAPALTFSPAGTSLVAGSVGTTYSQTVTASGGTAPYAYTVSGGSLPAGLSLDGTSGALFGTPTAGGTASFSITATDALGVPGAVSYKVSIGKPAKFSFSPAGGGLKEAMAGEAYSQQVSASGGGTGLIYSLASGSLPNGMVLNISTGELTGPLAADAEGNYAFAISVRDSSGATGSASYTLKVGARQVAVADQAVAVAAGSTPNNVYLNKDATGGPFTRADIVAVEPPSAGTATVVRGELAALSTSATPIGWYLQFTPNSSYSGPARVRFRLTSALGLSNTGTITYNLSYDAYDVAADINTLVRGFVQSRQNMISSSIRVPGLLERRQMAIATEPVTTTISPSAQGISLGFSTSFAQLEAARDHMDGVSSNQAPSLFNIWIDGALLAHNRDENGSKWGSFAMVNLGADYLLSQKALIGLSFHFDRMTDPSDEDAELTGNGWLAGPNASLEIGKGVFWDTSLLYGGSSNDIDTALWDGTFDTRRWMFDTAIKGQWNLDGSTILTPKLRTVYFSETVEDYSVRNSSRDIIGIDGFIEKQLRVSLGAEIARQFMLDSGAKLTPKIGLTGGFSGLDGSGAFASVTAGLSFTTSQNVAIETGLLLNIEGDGQQSVGAKVGVSGQF